MTAGAIRAARAFVEINLQDEAMIKGFQRAKLSMESFANKAKSIGANFAALGASIVAPFALAVREFAGFEQEMVTVGAVTNATREQFAQLNEEAKRLGITTTFTATEAATAMEVLGRAGFDTDEILKAIPNTLSLARATATELGEAARITASTMRVFGLEAFESKRVVDVLTATSITSAQTVESLAEAFKFVGPFAKQAGLSIEETAATLGVLADNGIRGTIAGTGLARILKNLSQAKKIDFLADLGVQVSDSIGNFRSTTDILRDLLNVTKDVGSVERLSIFEQLFGRGAAAAITIAQNADNVTGLKKRIDDLDGIADKTAKTMDDTLAGSMRLATSAAQGLGLTIGKILTPTLRWALETFREAAIAIDAYIKTNKTLVFAIAAVGAAFAGTGGIALFLGAMSSIGASIAALGPGVTVVVAKFALMASVIAISVDAMKEFTIGSVATGVAMDVLLVAMNPLIAAIVQLGKVMFALSLQDQINQAEESISLLRGSTMLLLKDMQKLSKASGTGQFLTVEQAAKDARELAVNMARAGDNTKEIVADLRKGAAIHQRTIDGMKTRLKLEKDLSTEERQFLAGQISELQKRIVALREVAGDLEEADKGFIDEFIKDVANLAGVEKKATKSILDEINERKEAREKELEVIKEINKARERELERVTDSIGKRVDEMESRDREEAFQKAFSEDPSAAVDQLTKDLEAALKNTSMAINKAIVDLTTGDLVEGQAEAITEHLEGLISMEDELRQRLEQSQKELLRKRQEGIRLREELERDLLDEQQRILEREQDKQFKDLLERDPASALAGAEEALSNAIVSLEFAIRSAQDSADLAAKTGRTEDIEAAKADQEFVEELRRERRLQEGFVDEAKDAMENVKIDQDALGTFNLRQARDFANRQAQKVQKEQLEEQKKMVDEQRKTRKAVENINLTLD